MLAPEGNVTAGRPRLPPGCDTGDHAIGGIDRLATGNAVDARDVERCEGVPPLGNRSESLRDRGKRSVRAGSGRLSGGLHRQVEQLRDQVNQHVDAVVADAVLHARKETELPLKAEDIPGIDDGPALDGPLQQVVGLGQVLRSISHVTAGQGQVSDPDTSADLGQHAGRSTGTTCRLARAGV